VLVEARWASQVMLSLARCHRVGGLLHFLHGARQQLLRLALLSNDPRKVGAVVPLVQPGAVLDVAAKHANALSSAADDLYHTCQHLKFTRVPLFDVQSALEVLSKGWL